MKKYILAMFVVFSFATTTNAQTPDVLEVINTQMGLILQMQEQINTLQATIVQLTETQCVIVDKKPVRTFIAPQRTQEPTPRRSVQPTIPKPTRQGTISA